MTLTTPSTVTSGNYYYHKGRTALKAGRMGKGHTRLASFQRLWGG